MDVLILRRALPHCVGTGVPVIALGTSDYMTADDLQTYNGFLLAFSQKQSPKSIFYPPWPQMLVLLMGLSEHPKLCNQRDMSSSLELRLMVSENYTHRLIDCAYEDSPAQTEF